MKTALELKRLAESTYEEFKAGPVSSGLIEDKLSQIAVYTEKCAKEGKYWCQFNLGKMNENSTMLVSALIDRLKELGYQHTDAHAQEDGDQIIEIFWF